MTKYLGNSAESAASDVPDGTVGNVRFRRRPLARLAAMARRSDDRDVEPISTEGRYDATLPPWPDIPRARTEEEILVLREAGRKWIEAFTASSDPKLVVWLRAIGVFVTNDVAPWRTWENFKKSSSPTLREWLIEMSGEREREDTPRP